MTKLLCIALVSSFLILNSAFCEDRVVRDKDGKIIARISDTANGRTIRDANGKIIGKIDKDRSGKQEPRK
jgi:hypothetical protein